jgi:hypothetical protein
MHGNLALLRCKDGNIHTNKDERQNKWSLTREKMETKAKDETKLRSCPLQSFAVENYSFHDTAGNLDSVAWNV